MSKRKLKILQQPILHRKKYVERLWPPGPDKAPWDLSYTKGAFSKPDDLTIVTASTAQPGSTFFEQSMEFIGITDYEVLRWPTQGSWRNIFKIVLVLNYLQSRECKTPYILYCDAFDTIVVNDLRKAVTVFEASGTQVLFSSTVGVGNIYREQNDLWEWSRSVALRDKRYLNAGVYIGTTDFVTRMLDEALKLVGKVSKHSTRSDQDVLRYLHRDLYPEMGIDYFNEIAYRN